MNDEEIRALKSEGIVDAYKTHAEYRILLALDAGGHQAVRFRVLEHTDNRYSVDQSYDIVTPTQEGPRVSADAAYTPEQALHHAVSAMSSSYNSAVREGYEPSAKSFIPNDRYDERG